MSNDAKYIVESKEELPEIGQSGSPTPQVAVTVDMNELNAKLDALLRANGIDPSSIEQE